ncbi:MAG: tetratricopeptide repeat protein [Candidatus Helarchaeota archaeon]
MVDRYKGKTAKELYKMAQVRGLSIEERVDLLEHALQKDPEFIKAYELLALYVLRYNVDWAREILEKIIELNPKSVFAWNTLGEARAANWDFKGAKECFNEVLKIDPDNETAKRFLKKGFRIEGKTAKEWCAEAQKEGIEDYDRVQFFKNAITLEPESSRAYELLGLHYKKDNEMFGGLYYDAIKAFEMAILYNPKSVLAWQALGDIYAQRWELGKAVRYYKIVLQLEPANKTAKSSLLPIENWKNDESILSEKKAFEDLQCEYNNPDYWDRGIDLKNIKIKDGHVTSLSLRGNTRGFFRARYPFGLKDFSIKGEFSSLEHFTHLKKLYLEYRQKWNEFTIYPIDAAIGAAAFCAWLYTGDFIFPSSFAAAATTTLLITAVVLKFGSDKLGFYAQPKPGYSAYALWWGGWTNMVTINLIYNELLMSGH